MNALLAERSPDIVRQLAAQAAQVRSRTLELCLGLSAEDMAVQSMPEASPLKWHLGHTSWFFETFVLHPYLPDYTALDPAYAMLFNSYYNSVGAQHPRPQRGLLTRPSLAQVLQYRRHVDTGLFRLLEQPLVSEAAALIELGLQHELQHQELMLSDLKHLLAQNPMQPAYRSAAGAASGPAPLIWHSFRGGIAGVGALSGSFAFDNERPRHRIVLQPYALASRWVTNAEFLAFVRDGGYRRPELWLADGWTTAQARQWQRPLYWSAELDSEFTLSGPQPLDPYAPVCHLSYYEADAYARWAHARLPTEFEWENSAHREAVDGQFADSNEFHPRTTASLFGSVWAWTASAYAPYPGYRPPAGAVGEYNGKFMCNQMVLRGGSCATPRAQVRASYRNFFYPDARWQFSGLRLARDL